MTTIKNYTDIVQSKKLAEILPLESADMVLPFTHKENSEYVPGYAVSRNYIEAYNEMLLLPAMDKDTLCKLIQPCWSLAALFKVIRESVGYELLCNGTSTTIKCELGDNPWSIEINNDNELDVCCEMIFKLNKLNLL